MYNASMPILIFIIGVFLLIALSPIIMPIIATVLIWLIALLVLFGIPAAIVGGLVVGYYEQKKQSRIQK